MSKNIKPSTGLKFIQYARKSSESEERQAASIESQEAELSVMAIRDVINITFKLSESHSAKRPGRPVFGEMVQMIETGKANAIFTWHINRLSRNAVDAGMIIDLMDRNKLLEIRTPSQVFRNSPDNKFLFTLFSSQAKLENDNKGVDVKRGLTTKVKAGVYPARAPIGYENDRRAVRGNKTILPDEDLFEIVRKLWDMMLTGLYSVPQLVKIANDELGYKSIDGLKLSRSTLYHTFGNTFYYGKFEWPLGSGDWYDGIHKPMITKEEFDKVQRILGRVSQPRPQTHIHDFSVRGFVRCVECGSMITAEKKIKRQKNGNVHEYIYYHCTHRIDPNCSQRANVLEKDLEQQVLDILNDIEISEELHRWAMNELKRENRQEAEARVGSRAKLQRQYDLCDEKIVRMINMRANDELTEDEFRARKDALRSEKTALQAQLDGLDSD